MVRQAKLSDSLERRGEAFLTSENKFFKKKKNKKTPRILSFLSLYFLYYFLSTKPAGNIECIDIDSISRLSAFPTKTWNKKMRPPEVLQAQPKSDPFLASVGNARTGLSTSCQVRVEGIDDHTFHIPQPQFQNPESSATKSLFHKCGTKIRLVAKSDLLNI